MALELRGNKLTTGREANRVVELLVKLTEFEFKKENTLVWSDNDWSTRASLSGRGLLERIQESWKSENSGLLWNLRELRCLTWKKNKFEEFNNYLQILDKLSLREKNKFILYFFRGQSKIPRKLQ